MGRLEGKVGFVTGGGTGLGLACAKALVAEGARVVLAGRRQEVLEAAAAELGPGDLIKRADNALYRAKGRGRNTIFFETPVQVDESLNR